MAEPKPTPRVTPRIPVEDRVDRKAHPPRRVLPTTTEDGPRQWKDLHWTTKLALAALAVFWASVPTAGFVAAALGWMWGLGFVGLAGSSLVVSLLLGGD